MKARSYSDYLLLILKGLAMGAANKIPGVSGGVVAFVAGFYEEFIFSLQRINGRSLKLFFGGRWKSFFSYINGSFLFAIILGMLISFFSVSKLLDYLIELYPIYVWSAFFGMIIGSIYAIGKHFKNWNLTAIFFLITGTLIGLYISFMNPMTENDNLFFVFLCGVISVSGMTLPGLSGSFILIILGNYVLLLVDSVNALYDTFKEVVTGNFSFANNPERMRMLQVLAVFTTGSVTGMVSFSHLINYLLKHYKTAVISTITGFIVGSLGVIWPWKEIIYKTTTNGSFILDANHHKIITHYKHYIPELNTQTSIAILYIILGILLILALEWHGKQKENQTDKKCKKHTD